jgi:hypothetical protein
MSVAAAEIGIFEALIALFPIDLHDEVGTGY